MSGIVHFITSIASAVTSFFHGVSQLVQLVATAYFAIPSYLGVWVGIFGAWIAAGLACCVIFRVIGRE